MTYEPDPVEEARDYIKAGWTPIPVARRAKNPIEDAWQTRHTRGPVDPESMRGHNVGVALGIASNGLVDVDIDCVEALSVADYYLPPTLTFGRPGAQASHRLYYSVGPTAKYTHGKKADGHGVMIELRSSAAQTVFPGSIHESGEIISWVQNGFWAPVTIEYRLLAEKVRLIAVQSLLMRHAGVDAPREIHKDITYFDQQIAPQLEKEVLKKAREWLGFKATRQEKKVFQQEDNEFKRAVGAYNQKYASQADEWPVSGGTCPACEHNGCFGTHPQEALRWVCFSASHADSRAGRVAPDGTCWSGDILDLAACEAKSTPRQLLIRDSFLDGLILSKTDKGGYKPTLGNVINIMRHHPVFADCLRYDEHACREVWGRVPTPLVPLGVKPGNPVTDRDDLQVTHWIEIEYKVAIPHKLVGDGIRAAAQWDTFNPLHELLESVSWDGIARIDNLLPAYLGAQDNPTNRAYGSRWMIASIARAYDPGVKSDCALVLVGEQGFKKSTVFSTLALRPEFFTDDVGDIGDNKACAERLQGKWIVEAAEMSNMRKSEVREVKAFISRTSDNYRPSYGRRNVDFPRRCSFGASSNDFEPLVDPTGGRRFWPVETPKRMNMAKLKEDVMQLWAEALVRWRAGERHWIDEENESELYLASKKVQEEYTIDSPYTEQIVKGVGPRTVVIIDRILKTLDVDPRFYPTVRQDAAAILTKMGFTNRGKTRVNGIPLRVWARHEVTAEGAELAEILAKELGQPITQTSAPPDNLIRMSDRRP